MPRPHSVLPTCLGIVICDTVIEDARTRNKSLINMFSGILASDVPARHDKLCVFAAFTGGRGRVGIELRLCLDAEYENDLLRMKADVDFPPQDPQAVVDLVFEIRQLCFAQFGRYTFEVLCDGAPLIARRFQVQKSAPGGPPPPTL